jgi:hypothetical protein
MNLINFIKIEIIYLYNNINKLLMLLYHGGTLKKMNNMIENGFHKPENIQGDNFGITYGPGLYFALNKNDALFYSDNNQIIEVIINKKLKLLRINPISPNNKKQKYNLLKKRKKGINNNYDGFIVTYSSNESEIIIWDPEFIKKEQIKLITI